MDKLEQHVKKQVRSARDTTMRKLAEGDTPGAAKVIAELDVAATAKAAARVNAEATALAGLSAMTAEQRESLFRKLRRKK